MRQMVIGRKGALPVADGAFESEDEGAPAGEEGSEDVATCPNCACEFDAETGDVMKPGAEVEGGPENAEGYQGAELNTLEDAEPTPGKAGGAHDAAVGDAVMAALMGGPRSSLARAR